MDFSLSSWEQLGAAVGIGATALTGAGALARGAYRAYRSRRVSRAAAAGLSADLYPEQAIEAATQLYVEHSVQTLDPDASADEPGLMIATKELAFHALDRILNSPTQYRYIVILAGSGMGKTSLLLNYFAKHRQKRSRPFEIALVPLSVPDADSRIATVANKPHTVLFLDALDEDAKAVQSHKDRLAELTASTVTFRKVLITCRTQFFSTAEEEPGDAGVIRVTPRRAGEPAGWKFHKIYLSPFDAADVRKYLGKRFPFWKRATRKRAEELIGKIPNLVVRPMLLAYVEDLLRKPEVLGLADLYAAMIDAWLSREEGILPGVKKEPLYKFSRRLAVNLWLFRAVRGAERIPKSEVVSLAHEYGIPLESWQLTSRSLLNRDTTGNYKFAHRSILEFLLVLEFLEGNSDCRSIDWTDQMQMFLRSIAECKPLWGSVEYGRVPTRSVRLEFHGVEPPGLRRLRKTFGSDTALTDAIDFPERVRQLKPESVPSLLLPDEPNDGRARRIRWHLVEDEKTHGASGRALLDHSEGNLWWIPDSDPTTLTKARQQLARMEGTRWLAQVGWRFATGADFDRCCLVRQFTKDWYVIDSTPVGAKEIEWSLGIQLYHPDGYLSCLARPTLNTFNDPTRGTRYRYCYVCDL